MSRKSLARFAAVGAAVGALAVMVAAAPAGAAPVKFPVDVVVHTDIGGAPSAFEGNLPGCETGWVEEGDAHVRFMDWGGVYVGEKMFTCDGGDAGFTVKLKARFGEFGSTGSWTLTDAWGDFAGVKASGSLVGTPTELGIDDRYTGSAR